MRLVFFAVLIVLAGCVSETQPGSFSTDFDSEQAAKTRVSLGLTYLKNGNYAQAKQNLDKALEYAPRLAETHYALAYYYQLVGETQRANDTYQTAMDLAPRDADIANSYGAFLCQQGQYGKAKEYFMQAVNSQQYSSSAETYENMALCAQSQGKIDDAIEYLNNALKHQPTRAKSLFLLTELYVGTAQFDLAAQTLRRYEKVARVTADSLWMAIEVAEGQGEYAKAKGYGDMLIRMYPDNSLAQIYIKRQSQVVPVITRKSKSDVKPEQNTVAQQQAPTRKVKVVEPVKTETQTDKNSTSNTPEVEATVSSKAEPDAVADKNKQTDTPRFHIVQPKENLYRLSLKYNIKLNTLKEWNNLDKDGSIGVGNKLWLVPPAQQSE